MVEEGNLKDRIRKAQEENEKVVITVEKLKKASVMPQVNFLQKITFDKLYNNGFLIGIRSRTLSISSECNTI